MRTIRVRITDVLEGRQQWHVENADVRAGLAMLPDNAVHCVVTSPPYWGLRAYGTDSQVWGGSPGCAHNWNGRTHEAADEMMIGHAPSLSGDTCTYCGAWCGELGSEPDVASFVAHLVEVFRGVRRVLRPDGTLWVNLGASYAGSGKGPTGHNGIGDQEQRQGFSTGQRIGSSYGESGHTSGVTPPAGFKSKDLIMTPFFVAEALRQDGWWLRQVIVWDKPSCMPESVTDRCTTSHEYIFLLSKSPRYFFDADAIREGVTGGAHDRGGGVNPKTGVLQDGPRPKQNASFSGAVNELVTSRNKRSVWRVASEPLHESHFAAYPTQLVEPMILAGSSAHGVCGNCGAPWLRVVERTAMVVAPSARQMAKKAAGLRTSTEGTMTIAPTSTTTGWEPTCTCNSTVVPALVLDPFVGSGTTIIEALRHGRRAIGLELNPTYAEMARRRIQADAPLFNAEVV